MSLMQDVFLRQAKSFAKTGSQMLDAVEMDKLQVARDWQLLSDAATQLEQASRDIRRLEGALQQDRRSKAAPQT